MDKVAIYCRLSKEDLDKINKGDDSESIQNQKMMLVDYATSHDMQIYKIYSDDDFTGSDLSRPNWNLMLHDAKSGNFNIVVCKTQSRFARSLEVVEKYINGLFIDWGIRFISIVDNIDTNVKSTKKTSQINGLVDQWYLEDLSENIKRTFRQKMIAGEYLGSFAPYGYKKDENNRHKLVIDEEAAGVVKLIFELSSQGNGVNLISQKLSEMNIITPTEYKKKQGLNFHNPNSKVYSKICVWGFTTLKRILNNPVYYGTLIQGKEKKVSYKSNKVIIAPKNDWVIIENSHSPIISKDTFDRTQELLQIRRKTCKTTSGKKFEPHLFSGRIKCADCKSTMAKTSGRLAGGHDYFICQLAKKTKYENCTRHSIRYDELEKYIDNEIKRTIKEMINCGDNYEDIRKHFNKGVNDEKKILEVKTKIQKNNSKVEDINKSLSNMYVDKVKGIISENEFINIKDNLNKEVQELNEDILYFTTELKSLTVDNNKINNFVNSMNKHSNYKKITNEIVNDFIIGIYIHETDENGKQIIDIEWNV